MLRTAGPGCRRAGRPQRRKGRPTLHPKRGATSGGLASCSAWPHLRTRPALSTPPCSTWWRAAWTRTAAGGRASTKSWKLSATCWRPRRPAAASIRRRAPLGDDCSCKQGVPRASCALPAPGVDLLPTQYPCGHNLAANPSHPGTPHSLSASSAPGAVIEYPDKRLLSKLGLQLHEHGCSHLNDCHN